MSGTRRAFADVVPFPLRAGETGRNRLFRRRLYLRDTARLQDGAVIGVVKLIVVVVRAGEEELVGRNGRIGESPFDIESAALVRRAQVERAGIRAEVRIEEFQQVDEAHLGPIASRVREDVAIVRGIHRIGEPDLSEVGNAAGLKGLGFGFAKCWEEHPCENGDDGDDHQQFDQGERFLAQAVRATCGEGAGFNHDGFVRLESGGGECKWDSDQGCLAVWMSQNACR